MFKKKKAHGKKAVDMLKIIDDNTAFAVKEAFNSLCSNVLYLPISDSCKKLVITSSVPGEGKSYISINLAITLANNLINKKILLIDMDMRSPSVSKLFNRFNDDEYNAKVGLSDYLVGLAETPNIITTDIPGLSVLFSGNEIASPAGLICSEKMSQLISKCEKEYDYILIDTPPVSVVSDATLLVERVNGYILTVRSDYSSLNSLGSAERILNAVNAPILGVVLTGYNPKKSNTYNNYNKKKYYYGYYEYNKAGK
ncbi:MAG: CpsD/CapB family tyrosine-protein kinase [Clostridia bacterium]|nr:CpsD/CapB family tyrosine-protein kinase [Clostridia bacterium]